MKYVRNEHEGTLEAKLITIISSIGNEPEPGYKIFPNSCCSTTSCTLIHLHWLVPALKIALRSMLLLRKERTVLGTNQHSSVGSSTTSTSTSWEYNQCFFNTDTSPRITVTPPSLLLQTKNTSISLSSCVSIKYNLDCETQVASSS